MAAARVALKLLDEDCFDRIDGNAGAIETTMCEDFALTFAFGSPNRVAAISSLPMTHGAIRSWNDWNVQRDFDLIELFWLYQLNRGVYLSPRPQTRWIVTAAHTDEACAQLIRNARTLAASLLA
jgi:glutamate-1-semialdehyde 2,1-aminomutase